MIYFGYLYFSTIHLELKGQIRLYAPVVPLKTIPDLRPKWPGGGGGGLLPYISYIGMCRPKGFLSCFGLKMGIDFDHYDLKSDKWFSREPRERIFSTPNE